MPDIYIAKEKEKKAAEETSKSKKRETESVADKLKNQRTTNPLASLVIRPRKVTFETQEKEEKVILLARQHLITNVRWILAAVVMLFVPGFVLMIFPDFFSSFQYRSLLNLVWYLLTFSFVFQRFLRWFFNVSIITDERVVDIDFPSLLYRDISSTKIDMIQDISVKMGGFVRSLFNYGDVHIQTAAEQKEFIFEAISQPERVIKILNELIAEEEQEKIEGRVR
ncbi:hypothetical protein A2Z41_02650 [Microgenomates group bacterium RBG_19FT_COMBO_39_10]|nr:MAG: hypothetical protein A2Z41_02650 [Microgenomates group bacterium RBG_19FT_COMBO_39_10]